MSDDQPTLEDLTPTAHEREVGRSGVAAARAALAKAAAPSARPFVPFPKPKPIDPSEPREREDSEIY